jgi:hypothetical protein
LAARRDHFAAARASSTAFSIAASSPPTTVLPLMTKVGVDSILSSVAYLLDWSFSASSALSSVTQALNCC